MIKINVLLFFSFVLLSLMVAAKGKECKLIVFENVGYCPDSPGDWILSEMEFWNGNDNYTIKDSTYSVEMEYGEPLGEQKNSVLFSCKDFLDLDLLLEIILKSKKKFNFISEKFVENFSTGPKEKALPFGSFQIHAYDSDGFLMGTYYCEGIRNTNIWFNYLTEESKKIQSFVDWEFYTFLHLIIEHIHEYCIDPK